MCKISFVDKCAYVGYCMKLTLNINAGQDSE